jgi:hypothetical protein
LFQRLFQYLDVFVEPLSFCRGNHARQCTLSNILAQRLGIIARLQYLRKRLILGEKSTSMHFGQGHLKALSCGKTIWPHFSQICRPLSRIRMSANPFSETQYGQRVGCFSCLIVILVLLAGQDQAACSGLPTVR